MSRNIIIAGDCGGTKGDLLIIDADTGGILKRFRANGKVVLPPEFVAKYGGIGRSFEMGHYCLDKALEGLAPETARICYAGMHWRDDYFVKRNIKVISFLPSGEAIAAMIAEERMAGISTVVGTGVMTNVIFNDNRKTLIIDALGPVCGDWGGGYAIGQLFMRTLFKEQLFSKEHFWEIDEIYEVLQQQNCMATKMQYMLDPSTYCWEIVSWVTDVTDRSVVASLAKVCDDCARKGGRIAKLVLEQSAEDLADMICRTVDFHELHVDRQFPIVTSGSVIVNSDIYYDALQKAILKKIPDAYIIRSFAPQVVGHAMRMFREINAPTNVVERFRKEAAELNNR